MRSEGRLIAVIVFAMLLGASAALFIVNVPSRHAPLGPGFAILGLVLWVRALVLFARGVDRQNPWEVAHPAAAAAAVWMVTVSGWLNEREVGSLDWALLATGMLLALAAVGMKLRAITRKYENKRKAQRT